MDISATSTFPFLANVSPQSGPVPVVPLPEVSLVAAAQELVDATIALMQVQLQLQATQQSSAEAGIVANQALIREQIEAARRAADEAREQADEASSWGAIASVAKAIAIAATAVAAVASMVVTGGASAVALVALAGVLLSAGSGKISQACGGSKELETGLSIGGAVLGAVAGGAGLFAGAAAGASATTSGVVSTVQSGATVTSGAATVTQGVAEIEQGCASAGEIDARADGVEARAHQRALDRENGLLVQGLKELNKTFGRIKTTLTDTQQQVSDASLAMLATLAR